MVTLSDIQRRLFDREYELALDEARALSLERPNDIRARLLVAAALRALGGRGRIEAAIGLVDGTLHASEGNPVLHARCWLEMGRTLACRTPPDPDAVRAFEMTISARDEAPLVVARADQEHARLEDSPKWRERGLASAVQGFVSALGTSAHPFVEGVFLLGLVLEVPELRHQLAGTRARMLELSRTQELPSDVDAALRRGLDAMDAGDLPTAERVLREAVAAGDARELPRWRAQAPLTALSAVLSALGRFEEAEVAFQDCRSPEDSLLDALRR